MDSLKHVSTGLQAADTAGMKPMRKEEPSGAESDPKDTVGISTHKEREGTARKKAPSKTGKSSKTSKSTP